MLALLERAFRQLRRLVHLVLPHGSSPESYRRLMRALQKRFVYDARTQTVTVKRGELAGMKKCGPFSEADFEFVVGRYEPEVTAAFHLHCRPGMTVFDIGANAGHHTVLLSKLCGPSGHVHAFEPLPENAACLLETLRINNLRNVTVHQLAVAETEGEAEFRFSGVFDGFACLAQGGHGRPGGQATASISVRTMDLDAFCGKFAIPQVGLIKMDIEGAELLALRGMTRVLCRHRPVLIVELWGSEHIAAAPQFLGRFGYETQTLGVWRGLVQGAFAEISNVLAMPSAKPEAIHRPLNQGANFTEKFAQRGDLSLRKTGFS